jgi:hypothetical protein
VQSAGRSDRRGGGPWRGRGAPESKGLRERPPGGLFAVRADQAWLGFFIFFADFFLVVDFLAAFFLVAFFAGFAGWDWVWVCAWAIIGTVDAATNESRANAVISAFITCS